VDYDNAFWDGERIMFGDGDGELFLGFVGALDVIGHELTHGVMQGTLGLRYAGQSGALNESVADVFGALVKQYALGQAADRADWLIGAGVLGPALRGAALRSMRAPGTAFEGDSQPGHMRDYVRTAADNGGVHINSGIPNHAFYLAATKLGGYAWERAGRIWYQVLVTRAVGPGAHFAAFAKATADAAAGLYGLGSLEAAAVAEAWAEVGVR
jgi:Zn-dependent metalloprotease